MISLGYISLPVVREVMKAYILDDLLFPHGIFNDVIGRYRVGRTPPCLVIEHVLRECYCSDREVQVECK
jgi:hypothetical protein